MGVIEQQTIDILARLTDNDKLFILDFVKLVEQGESRK